MTLPCARLSCRVFFLHRSLKRKQKRRRRATWNYLKRSSSSECCTLVLNTPFFLSALLSCLNDGSVMRCCWRVHPNPGSSETLENRCDVVMSMHEHVRAILHYQYCTIKHYNYKILSKPFDCIFFLTNQSWIRSELNGSGGAVSSKGAEKQTNKQILFRQEIQQKNKNKKRTLL